MAFGIDSGISRTTNNTVQTAQMDDNNGAILEFTTFGGVTEVSEEGFLVGDAEDFENQALNGQVGDENNPVVVQHQLSETNTEYAKTTRVLRTPLPAVAIPTQP